MTRDVDVLVIGAGPAGLTAAYCLTKEMPSVLVVEKDPVYVGGISRYDGRGAPAEAFVDRAGSRTVPGLRYLTGFAEPPEVAQVQETMDDILRGAFTGDLGLALRRAGAVATLLAHGTAHLADEDPGEERTRQAERLLRTGEELTEAGRHAEEGRLD